MAGKGSDKFYKTVVFAEDMTDTMLEKVIATAKDAFQLQVTVRVCILLTQTRFRFHSQQSHHASLCFVSCRARHLH